LFQCLRRNRAGVPEGVLPESTGADPVRAAIPSRADRGVGDLHRARHSRSAEVSSARDVGREVNPILKIHRAETPRKLPPSVRGGACRSEQILHSCAAALTISISDSGSYL